MKVKMSGTGAKWRWLRENTASEIAEAALILPLLFTLMFAIYWFGRAFSIYSTINHAARQAVLTAASPACASCGNGLVADDVVAGVISQTLGAANLDAAKLKPSMPNPAPRLCPDPNVQSQPCAPASSGNFTICRNVLLDPNGTSQACGMIVSFQYPYQFTFPFTSLNQQLVNLRAQAEAVGEN